MSATTEKPLANRRRFLKWGGYALFLVVTPLARAAAHKNSEIIGVRVWPAADYTRVTIEHRMPLKFAHFTIKDPHRLVVDLEGIELNSVLESLSSKILPDDPNIQRLRAARYKPGIVRLVMDLKNEVKPQVFTLKPAGAYAYRLVLDVYPTEPPDPLLQWLKENESNLNADGRTIEPKNEPKNDPDPGRSSTATTERRGKPVTSRMVTIMLDPGHGGEDPGAIGHGGSYEKNVVLAIAQRLKARIDNEPNMRAALTRDTDFFVPLHVRVQKARRIKADLFVSIHADAFLRADAKGSSVFALSEKGASSSAARYLAQKENEADQIGGVNFDIKDPALARTLLDLSQTATISDSLKLGKSVLNELGQINTLHKEQVEQAGFAVLKAPDIPSILIETAFISNPEEERLLNHKAHQDKLADAIMNGIRAYFAKNSSLAKSKQG